MHRWGARTCPADMFPLSDVYRSTHALGLGWRAVSK